MPRLTPITKREQVSGDALTAFDAIIESRSLAGNPDSPQTVVFITSIIDAIAGVST